MKKTILVLLTISLLTTAFAGCGNSPDGDASDGTTSAMATTTAATTTQPPKQTEESKTDTTTNPDDQQPDAPPETTEKREHYSLNDYNSGLTYFITESDKTAQVDMNSLEQPYSSTIIIPSSVFDYQVIGIRELAFAGNEQITQVTIPASVKQIGVNAFAYCTNLTSVIFENPEGWTADVESVDVSDPAVAADLLTGAYSESIWTCN